MLSLLLAFAIVYIIWGSTYLAIRFAIDSIPPLIMAGVRFSIAGLLMYLWLRGRGTPAPTLVQWRSAFVIGGCLFLIANGLICTAEQTVPSGLTALLVATVPLWMTVLDWLAFGGPRPTLRISSGLLLGVVGILVLVNPSSLIGQPIHFPGAMAIMVSCISWAVGSLYARRAPLPNSVFMTTGMELFAGGVLLLLASLVRGDWTGFDPHAMTFRSIASMLYLLSFGSIVAFSAYVWLLNRVSPAAVSTYAFVNPAVAIALGWMFAQEPLGLRSLLASGLIIAAVVMITLRRASAETPAPSPADANSAAPSVNTASPRVINNDADPVVVHVVSTPSPEIVTNSITSATDVQDLCDCECDDELSSQSH